MSMFKRHFCPARTYVLKASIIVACMNRSSKALDAQRSKAMSARDQASGRTQSTAAMKALAELQSVDEVAGNGKPLISHSGSMLPLSADAATAGGDSDVHAASSNIATTSRAVPMKRDSDAASSTAVSADSSSSQTRSKTSSINGVQMMTAQQLRARQQRDKARTWEWRSWDSHAWQLDDAAEECGDCGEMNASWCTQCEACSMCGADGDCRKKVKKSSASASASKATIQMKPSHPAAAAAEEGTGLTYAAQVSTKKVHQGCAHPLRHAVGTSRAGYWLLAAGCWQLAAVLMPT
jgi:hypothetical protein